jgi:hypothetical protein
MPNGECPVGATLTAEVANLKESDEHQWKAIDKIENRVPTWATFLISGLTGAIGVLITLLVA